MNPQTIEEFFTGKTLRVPAYQRDYAWETKNIDDLFEDIEESMELGGGHYLGTFILSQTERNEPVYVVDGQQRLTTLTMVLNALVEAVEDKAIREHYRSTYIVHPVHGQKFTVLGTNKEFFSALLSKENPTPESAGQKRLQVAYAHITQRVQAIVRKGGQEALRQWLLKVSGLEVLAFIEKNEGKAIRMFQSVNDRGVQLSRMDITKSLLIYYSNRFLDGKHDAFISDRFGEAFRCFSRIKELGEEEGYQIKVINREPFREDDVLRYHYFAFSVTGDEFDGTADYNATSKTVLEEFLKPTLKGLRSDSEALSAFILDYVEDLTQFFRGLMALVEQVRASRQLYLLFVIQDLSALLYPLIIRAQISGGLTESIPGAIERTLLDWIEVADLRVFKLRGTDPQKDMVWLVRNFKRLSLEQVAEQMFNFTQRFMSSAKFVTKLTEDDMYKNPGLPRIFIEAEDSLRQEMGQRSLEISDLHKMVTKGITIEHILPQEASFGVRKYGFHSEESYKEHLHRLGNLAPLEKKINSACSNMAVETKMSEPKLYRASKYRLIQQLIAEQAENDVSFSKEAIVERGARLADFALKRWPITLQDLDD